MFVLEERRQDSLSALPISLPGASPLTHFLLPGAVISGSPLVCPLTLPVSEAAGGRPPCLSRPSLSAIASAVIFHFWHVL